MRESGVMGREKVKFDMREAEDEEKKTVGERGGKWRDVEQGVEQERGDKRQKRGSNAVRSREMREKKTGTKTWIEKGRWREGRAEERRGRGCEIEGTSTEERKSRRERERQIEAARSRQM